jgi:pyruvate-formate lyase-activating enzyme
MNWFKNFKSKLFSNLDSEPLLDLEKNKSWCPIPWVTYSINSLGQYRLCVQANSYKAHNDRWRSQQGLGKFTRGTLWESDDPNAKDNKPLNCSTTGLVEMRNNPFLKEVRAYMLRGERHPYCKRCNNEDDSKILSRRMTDRENFANQGFTINEAVRYTTNDGSITDTNKIPLLAADIRLGNLCNQKCRMCYPGESTAWYQEWLDTYQLRHALYMRQDFTTREEDGPPSFTGPGNTRIRLGLTNDKASIIEHELWDHEDLDRGKLLEKVKEDPYVWTDSRALFERLHVDSPDIHHVHMSGGEPLMITSHYEFLQGYVDNGKAKDITLNYNTNLSNIPQRALELWKHFGSVQVRPSIDGVGRVNEYIRYPSNWEIVLRNLRLLTKAKKSKKVNLSIHTITTVQIYNIFYLEELAKALTNVNDIEIYDMSLHMLHDPRYFNIKSLPSNVKDLAAEKLLKIPSKVGIWEKQIQGIINHMYSEDFTSTLDQFFIETRIMDKYRKQNFKEALPELHKILKGYDPTYNTIRKVKQSMGLIKDASIISIIQEDIPETSDLQYTQIQLIHKKDPIRTKNK